MPISTDDESRIVTTFAAVDEKGRKVASHHQRQFVLSGNKKGRRRVAKRRNANLCVKAFPPNGSFNKTYDISLLARTKKGTVKVRRREVDEASDSRSHRKEMIKSLFS